MYSGIWLPLVTPFRSNKVDVEALQRMTERYARTGITGFVVLGTTGEAALLSEIERVTVLQAVTDVVTNRLPVLVGVGGPDTREVVREMQRLEHWDIAGFLASAPAYLCPNQEGLIWHFGRIARATQRHVVLYDVPHRTGVHIETETVARLSELDNVVAIKACAAQRYEAVGQLNIDMLCGTDSAFLKCLDAGGVGGILASAHVFGDLLIEIQTLAQTGQRQAAQALFEQLRPLIDLLFSTPNPSSIKALLALDGHISDEVRMPITPLTSEQRERLVQAKSNLNRGMETALDNVGNVAWRFAPENS
jgi:4-hydroxy-tetrahydrodipicolinate synthase